MATNRSSSGRLVKPSAKKQANIEGEEVEPCEMCTTDLNSSSDALLCDKCRSKWACTSCLGIQKSVYKALHSNQHVMWLCQQCRSGNTIGAGATPKQLSEGVNTPDIASMLATMMQQLQRVEEKLDSKANARDLEQLSERVSALEEKCSKSENPIPASGVRDQLKTVVQDQVEQALDDYRDREARKLNLILFNASESDKVEIEERKSDDLELANKIIEATGSTVSPLTKIIRLGPRAEDKIRPMKVAVETVNDKWKILNGARRLKETDFRNVGIAMDLSKHQRAARKQLKQDLETRRNNGERNLSIRNGKIITKHSLNDDKENEPQAINDIPENDRDDQARAPLETDSGVHRNKTDGE